LPDWCCLSLVPLAPCTSAFVAHARLVSDLCSACTCCRSSRSEHPPRFGTLATQACLKVFVKFIYALVCRGRSRDLRGLPACRDAVMPDCNRFCCAPTCLRSSFVLARPPPPPPPCTARLHAVIHTVLQRLLHGVQGGEYGDDGAGVDVDMFGVEATAQWPALVSAALRLTSTCCCPDVGGTLLMTSATFAAS
jgi:hypothetical protein